MTREEVLERTRELVAEGWSTLPADDPERGMRGYVAFKTNADGEELSEILEWPLFQGPLTTDKVEVRPEELAEFLSGSGPLALCDDPRRLRVGFVRYRPEEGLALVRQTRMRLLKEADDSTRAAVMGVRDRLMAELPDLQTGLNP